MNSISRINARCVQVVVDQFPDLLTWTLEDGTQVQTTDLDLSNRAGRHLIAANAARLGLGDPRSIARYLRGITGVGVILPMDTTGLDNDDGFPAV